MKHFQLIWSGVWHKRSRTVLVLISTVVAFLMFGLLVGVNQGLKAMSESGDTNRVWVLSRGGSRDALPLAHQAKIEQVPGVRRVAPVTSLRGYYQDKRVEVSGSATDVAALFDVFPELRVDPQQLETMLSTRTGALVGSRLAARFGWKAGDRIPIGSSWLKRDGSNSWAFDVVGVFEVAPEYRSSAMANNLANRLIVNHVYFDAERAFLNNTVSQYFVATAAGAAPSQVARRVDQLFANSSGETLSQTETAGLSGLIQQVLDLDLIVKGVCGAALFSLLFLAGNTITQSAHERMAEFGVLKTLGYTDTKVSLLVLAESLIVFLLAAPIGLALAWYLVASLESMLGPIRMPVAVAVWGLLLAALAAVACALPPARRVSKLKIVDALANR